MKVLIYFILAMLICAFASKDTNRGGIFSRPLNDESTFSNINEIHTYHYDLEIEIDFPENLIHGHQTLYMTTQKFFVDKVSLDIRDLEIDLIYDKYGTELEFKVISDANPNLGQRLDIEIPKRWLPGSRVVLNIEYTTSKDASALTWLKAEQTAGGKKPFMYSQCESIHCRSIAPLQDTPAIKSTYTLHAISPLDIIVRASGNVTHEYVDEEKRHTSFEMTIPVQSYLLAFAAGNLVEKQIGARTFVITEPELMPKSVSELEDLDKAVGVAETYLTEYIWGTYKVLMLPPSFPYGGMENPLLTFANSALVTGDKSSFRLFVHELSHSWFGNLVTNENWSNFWLNEGFTVFLERKTDSILYGVDTSKIAAKLGNSSMYSSMLGYGLESNFTSLYPRLDGNHPDTSISGVPYEKGFQFLYYLETLIGENSFQQFLRDYVKKYSKKSIVVEDFKNLFEKHVYKQFAKKEAKAILDQINWQKWIYGPGLPPVISNFETKAYNQAIQIAQNIINGQTSEDDISTYKTYDLLLRSIVVFELVSNYSKLSAETVGQIDIDLGLSQETNPQIIYLWLQLAVRSGYHASPFTAADDFVGRVGRYAIIVPVYSAMQSIDRDTAWAIYKKHRSFYHPIARSVLEASLNRSEVTPPLIVAE